jgi:hypothetical protein
MFHYLIINLHNTRLASSGFVLFLACLLVSCQKEAYDLYDNEETIKITDKVFISNTPNMSNKTHNLVEYEKFLKDLVSTGRYLFVTQNELEKTTSSDKVIISIRHDIDNHINTAMKFAYREQKYGVRATYYLLHTADYYGKTKQNSFVRNEKSIFFFKKLQNGFGHELGFHNDLVTLQVVYGIDPKAYLKQELKWLRSNGIIIRGTCTHGSSYCYIYHYLNTYFWRSSPNFGHNFYNYEYIYKAGAIVHMQNTEQSNINFSEIGYNYQEHSSDPEGLLLPEIKGMEIIKDDRVNYNLEYDGDYIHTDYNFSDVKILPGGKRWHMSMEDFNKIPAGKKVIILIHPLFWD